MKFLGPTYRNYHIEKRTQQAKKRRPPPDANLEITDGKEIVERGKEQEHPTREPIDLEEQEGKNGNSDSAKTGPNTMTRGGRKRARKNTGGKKQGGSGGCKGLPPGEIKNRFFPPERVKQGTVKKRAVKPERYGKWLGKGE